MLVIFDCDGVLVDSEPLAAEVFSLQLATVGLRMSATECHTTFHGRTLAACFEWLEGHYNCQLPADFGEQLAAATREAFAGDLQPVTGVEDVLESLTERAVPFCVASNGEHRKIAHSLAITGLERFFPDSQYPHATRFSREDVASGKPAPDLFLFAAENFGVPARFCTVVEDSATGFAAARAAGMKLIEFQPAALPDRQADGGWASSMSEVRRLLLS